LVLMSGFSGHGFKFGALMGHLAAAVATKKADPESIRSLAAGEISDPVEIERLTGQCLA
jgi:glycine/D-amino acid oxidase-like deaminating enzyme